MNRNVAAGVLLGALGALPSVCFADAQEEVDKQISKAISDTINARVSSQALAANDVKPAGNNVWASYGRLSISQEGANGFDFTVPTYLVGYDRDIRGKAMVGVSASYYTFNTNIGAVSLDSKTFSISPYFAWLFSKNYFATVKVNVGFGTSDSDFSSTSTTTGAGFSSTSSTSSSTSSDLFNWGLDFSLNGLWRTGNLITKGLVHVGYLYSYTDSTTTSSTSTRTTVGATTTTTSSTSYSYTSTDSDQIPYGLEGEAGYLLPSRSYVFGGLAAAQSNKSNSFALNGRIGFEQQFGRGSAVGIKYETRLSDNSPSNAKVDVSSIFITGRIAF